jgi:hypothetical protein
LVGQNVIVREEGVCPVFIFILHRKSNPLPGVLQSTCVWYCSRDNLAH